MIIDPRSAAIFAVLAFLILAASAIVASAEQAGASPSQYRPLHHWDAHEWRVAHHRRRKRTVRRETYREREDATHGRCKSPVAVVGDQYASESGAKAESDKAWSQTVRYMHGERWMSRDHADSVFYECGRSSVGSIVGQVFYRCRIVARPCRPEPQSGDR